MLTLLAILGGSYWFYFKDNEVNYTNDQISATPGPDLDITEISIDKMKTIEWSQGTVSAQIRQFETGKWEFVQPLTLQIDNDKAQMLAESLDSLGGTPKISTSELSLKDAGFENPYAKITVKRDDGPEEVILVGTTSLDGASRYVHRQGSDFMVLVYTYKLDSLLSAPNELIPDPTPQPSSS